MRRRYVQQLAHHEAAPMLEQAAARASLHEIMYREALDAAPAGSAAMRTLLADVCQRTLAERQASWIQCSRIIDAFQHDVRSAGTRVDALAHLLQQVTLRSVHTLSDACTLIGVDGSEADLDAAASADIHNDLLAAAEAAQRQIGTFAVKSKLVKTEVKQLQADVEFRAKAVTRKEVSDALRHHARALETIAAQVADVAASGKRNKAHGAAALVESTSHAVLGSGSQPPSGPRGSRALVGTQSGTQPSSVPAALSGLTATEGRYMDSMAFRHAVQARGIIAEAVAGAADEIATLQQTVAAVHAEIDQLHAQCSDGRAELAAANQRNRELETDLESHRQYLETLRQAQVAAYQIQKSEKKKSILAVALHAAAKLKVK